MWRLKACRRASEQVDPPQAGYLAVDAIVAMMILAVAAILSLAAVEQSERAAGLADEVRSADAVIAQLMLSAPANFQPLGGETSGFRWTVTTELTGADRPVAVCRRVVLASSVVSHRQYSASTLAICPNQASS